MILYCDPNKVVEVAHAQLGHGGWEYQEFAGIGHGPNSHWCMAYAGWLQAKAGHPLPGDYNTAWVPNVREAAIRDGIWADRNASPPIGSLVPIQWNGGTDYPDHVETVIGYDGAYVLTSGGNDGGGGVAPFTTVVREYRRDRSIIAGFVVIQPVGSATPSTDINPPTPAPPPTEEQELMGAKDDIIAELDKRADQLSVQLHDTWAQLSAGQTSTIQQLGQGITAADAHQTHVALTICKAITDTDKQAGVELTKHLSDLIQLYIAAKGQPVAA